MRNVARKSLHEFRDPAATTRHLRSIRFLLGDGRATTIHVARYDTSRTAVQVVRLPRAQPLEAWCAEHGVDEAIVGGFFLRPCGTPLGELRTHGIARETVPFDPPWDAKRSCVHVAGGRVAIVRRPDLAPEPPGDLLQAGPLLVAGGVPCADGDPEGFSAAAHQFDSDITAERHPRAAVALDHGGHVLAVAADGRAEDDAGLTLEELAGALVRLGARHALNLDGGGSASLVCGGRLRNRPREAHDGAIEGGRPITTALTFCRR